MTTAYHYTFNPDTPPGQVAAALGVAVLAAEGLHGAAARLDAGPALDPASGACVVPADTVVGRGDGVRWAPAAVCGRADVRRALAVPAANRRPGKTTRSSEAMVRRAMILLTLHWLRAAGKATDFRYRKAA